MNRAFLKGLGLEADTINAIMEQYGIDVSNLNSQITTLTTERDTAKADLATSNEALKKFDGVDIEALKQASENIKTQYEQKIKDMQIDNAVKEALTTANAKHIDLLSTKFDREKIKFTDDGKLEGIDEQLANLKENYKDLFTANLSGHNPSNPDSSGNDSVFNFGFTNIRGEK